MEMVTALLIAVLIVSAASLAVAVGLWLRTTNTADPQAALAVLGQAVQTLERSLSEKFSSARTDMASRL